MCTKVGGCITGEHGVGLEKIKQMETQFSQAEIEQFHAIKRVFDPAGTLNPGKGIPILKRCQEYRSIDAEGLTPGVEETLRELVGQGKTAEAIEAYRAATGADRQAAVTAVTRLSRAA